MIHRHALVAMLPVVLSLACSSGTTTTAPAGGSSAATTSSGTGGAGADAGVIGGDRPVEIVVPSSYAPGTPVPLVMMLHGYAASADLEELYLGIKPLAQQRGFIYALPNGTVDKDNSQFWNASDACCDLYDVPVDDSGYLSSVISEIEARYSIDPKRVYLVGHSNGGFMAYRMACDHADQIAAIVSLAGAMPDDPTLCKPAAPVSILEVHGTADQTILYDGGLIGANAYPGATTTVGDWVTLDGCTSTPDTTAPPLDLDTSLPGDETTVTRYAAGCAPGGHAELWTITGGSHVPLLSDAFTPDIVAFLYDHPKP